MNELIVAEEKGLKDVLVFQICECDAVAAYSQDEAREWYKDQTGLTDDELYSYDEVDIVPLDSEVYEDEERKDKVSVQEIINRYWNGEPFIALSTES